MTPLSTDRSAHLLSVKSNTVFNALTRRMAALITFLLWQTVLFALAFLLLILLDVTAANMDKAMAWWKAGSPSGVVDIIIQSVFPLCVCVCMTLWLTFLFQLCVGNNDISSQCKKMHTFKSIFVQCPFNLQMTVTTK